MAGAAAAAGFLTLFSMVKIWSGAFWNPREAEPQAEPHDPGRWGGPGLMVAPTALLAALAIGIGLAAGPIYAMAESAAAFVLDPEAYRTLVGVR